MCVDKPALSILRSWGDRPALAGDAYRLPRRLSGFHRLCRGSALPRRLSVSARLVTKLVTAFLHRLLMQQPSSETVYGQILALPSRDWLQQIVTHCLPPILRDTDAAVVPEAATVSLPSRPFPPAGVSSILYILPPARTG